MIKKVRISREKHLFSGLRLSYQLSNTTANSDLWRHRVIVGPVSIQIDLRSTKDPVAIL